MRHILARPQREVLEQLSFANVLLGFDFDGTLAPITRLPDQARMTAATRALLVELAGLYPCIVISGRAQADVARRLAGVPLRAVIGNHGLEPWATSEELRRIIARWREVLAPAAAALPGVELEDKAYSLALHYRRSRRKKAARAALMRALAKLEGARIVGGKQVINVLPPGAPHKGVALERERDRLGCDTAFFLGDDETDEDVFALDRPGRLLTVRVGASRDSQASFCLKSRREVDLLLARLIALRRSAQRWRRAR
jgi:trehalose 6-phosphate phosphatase